MGISIDNIDDDTYYPKKQDAKNRDHYYSSIKDPAKASFKSLHNLLEQTHTTHHKYSPAKYVYPLVDLHPDGQLRSIYSMKTFTVQELILADQKVDIERQMQFIELVKNEKEMGLAKFNLEVEKLESTMPYNCEHVVCQSWFRKQEPMRGDLHHLFACEARCNLFRNNFPYHDFPAYNPQPIANAEKEKPACGNAEQGFFEPENNKAIVARAVLYFLVRYPDSISVYHQKDIQTLKDWALKEPVTLYELHRNYEIHLLQGNRNPFIDYPNLIKTLSFT